MFKVFNIYDKILLHAFYQLLENTSRATARRYSATSCWMINHKLVFSNRVSKIKYGTEPWGSWPWREVQRSCEGWGWVTCHVSRFRGEHAGCGAGRRDARVHPVLARALALRHGQREDRDQVRRTPAGHHYNILYPLHTTHLNVYI